MLIGVKVKISRKYSEITPEPLRAPPRLAPVRNIEIALIIVVGLTALLISAKSSGPIDLKSYHPKTASVLYASDGSLLGSFYSERRFSVALNTVPEHVREAFVATEDARFFSHLGIDPPAILRAFVTDIRKGTFAQGGSTITQQVARSILLTKEKTISRKLREVMLALRIERSNSKAQILETYLNQIYLGRGSYGIEAAAEAYFGKTTPDLTIGEGAYIAGLASNPSKYTPENPEKGEARRQYVLQAMLNLKYISESQYQQASGQKIEFIPAVPNYGPKKSYFTEAVRRYVVSKYGEKALYEDGVRVWTTVDPDLQRRAEEAVLHGARAWEQRHGRPAGLVKRLNPAEVQEIKSSAADSDLKRSASVQAVVVSSRPIKTKSKRRENQYQVAVMVKGGVIHTVQTHTGVPYWANDLVTFTVKEIAAGKPVLEQESVSPVQGALVSIENNTGYIRALVGGTGGDKAGFNRASQALRQPGSSFKPVLYSAALEWGKYDPQNHYR